jgi:hypothetical protein
MHLPYHGVNTLKTGRGGNRLIMGYQSKSWRTIPGLQNGSELNEFDQSLAL